MSPQADQELEKEIVNIKFRQEQSLNNYFDNYVCKTALHIAETRQKFEKENPGIDFEESFLIGFLDDNKSLVVFRFINGQWSCYAPGFERYKERDSNLINLLNKFLHVK